MSDLSAETPDSELAYAQLKAGYRPFDSSQFARRLAALNARINRSVSSTGPRKIDGPKGQIIDLDLERLRRCLSVD